MDRACRVRNPRNSIEKGILGKKADVLGYEGVSCTFMPASAYL